MLGRYVALEDGYDVVMWVSRLRARFQGLQIQWLSSPLGAEKLARLRSPGLRLQRGPREGSQASKGD